MFKIEFDAENKPLAAAIGKALTEYAGGVEVHPNADGSHRTVITQSVDELAGGSTSISGGVVTITGSATNLVGPNTSTPAQNSTISTGDESTSQNEPSGDYAFEQHWLSASGLDYLGYDIDPELGVPVDAKGFPLIDTYGVPHDADMCARASSPFYASGANKGKWKTKVGVTKDKYSAWYEEQLEQMGEQDTDESTGGHTGANAADAFGADNQNAAGPGDTKNPTANIGDLMAWIGEQQAGGNLGQQQIQTVYQQCNTDIASLAQPGNQQARDTVYSVLAGMVGA